MESYGLGVFCGSAVCSRSVRLILSIFGGFWVGRGLRLNISPSTFLLGVFGGGVFIFTAGTLEWWVASLTGERGVLSRFRLLVIYLLHNKVKIVICIS